MKSPVGIVVTIAVSLVLLLVMIVGAIIANNAFTWRAIHEAEHKASVTEAALRVREAESQVRTSIPTCQALLRLDDVRDHHAPVTAYDKGISTAFHQVVVGSKCRVLIYDLNHGVPVSKIVGNVEKTHG